MSTKTTESTKKSKKTQGKSAAQNQREAGRSKTIKRLNKEIHKASKVVTGALGDSLRVHNNVRYEKNAYRTPLPRSILSKWAYELALPFEHRGATCPVNFNPAPSLMYTTATTTFNDANVSVAANSTTQYVFYPGHGPMIPTNQSAVQTVFYENMDAVAYHSVSAVRVGGGTVVTVGPINLTAAGGGTAGAVNHLRQNGLPVGGCTNSTIGSVFSGYDESLPYGYGGAGSSSQTSNHVRWQLVSMGIRLVNQTPQISRGGNVVSVQLVNAGGLIMATGGAATSQAQLEHNPSYKLLGICDKLTEISWIPRTQDLAYWHSVVPGSFDANTGNEVTTFVGASIGLFLNNPTSAAQDYAIQVIYNWQISGSYLASVSEAAQVEPILKAPVEQTIIHLANSSSTAAHAPIVAAAASRSPAESTGMLEKLGNAAFDGLADMAHTATKAFVDRASSRVHRMLMPNGP